MASLPFSTAASDGAASSKSAAPALSSETCSLSVSIVSRVKLQSTVNTNLDIDELLFGF